MILSQNRNRIRTGASLLKLFLLNKKNQTGSLDTDLIDCLVDLLHFAHSAGLNVTELSSTARNHVLTECQIIDN